MTTRNLQREIAPKKDAGDSARLLRVEMEIVANAREGEGDIGAVDEGDGVHDQRDGDDASPAGWCEIGSGQSGRDVDMLGSFGGGVHWRSPRRLSRQIRLSEGVFAGDASQERGARFWRALLRFPVDSDQTELGHVAEDPLEIIQ